MHIRLEGRATRNGLPAVSLMMLDDGCAKLDFIRLDKESIVDCISLPIQLMGFIARAAS
jgi:hypothetical protein